MKSKREFTPSVKREVELRAGSTCEFAGCTRPIECYHHRLRKSQGGLGTLTNAAGLCNFHHQWIHNNTGEAYELGYLIHAGAVNTGLKR